MLDSVAETKLPDTINTAHLRILLRISKPSRVRTNRSSDFRSKLERNVATRSSAKPQGISKTQRAKTKREKARKE
jgi:hypothetical protein